ncbi:non-homologous end-joining DNA ligase [Ensifer sp. 22521]|uniref:non-homologous end-joining DNA ligase n=1 Tax=Ensifer sp. 22521 TaxID=3453935 RepID=UPI003F82E70A
MAKQPKTTADPMPLRARPCLPKQLSAPPKGPGWVHEIKWDGWRVHVHVETDGVRILSKEGRDITKRFVAIAEAAEALRPHTLIIDGEAVYLDKNGRPVFRLLQQARYAQLAHMIAFDLLYLDGRDLRPLPLSDRRPLLVGLLAGNTGTIILEEWLSADGPTLFAAACEQQLEGIVSKKLDAPYRSGETGDWIKVICPRRANFLIVGFERSSALPSHLGSLHLAAMKGSELVYVGSVGTGFTQSDTRLLPELLGMITTASAPVVPPEEKKVVFTKPKYVATVEYRTWTTDNRLRHPSFKNIEERTDAIEVYQLTDAAK